jgi:hypothetical protein
VLIALRSGWRRNEKRGYQRFRDRSSIRRVKAAGFPRDKWLGEFDFDANPGTRAAHKGRWRETARRRALFLSYFVSAPSNQDLSTGAGAAPACLATILPSSMTINVGTA